VKSLAGLDVFLRGARKGDVLIIDEPEMNAHPAAQMGLVELFAMMANQGIRVVLATHSPYIVDHLTNLVEASTLPAVSREEIARSLALGSESAFLQPDKLAVHWFERKQEAIEVAVRPVFDRRERDIDWSTFSDMTDRISSLYSRILEAGDERDT
jgi:predicted ATPase